MEITRIFPEDIEHIWDILLPLVSNERMLNNWVSSETLKTQLISNKADLWVNYELTSFAIGATYSRTDGSKTYIVNYMASSNGSKEGWDETIKTIEEQAKDWGCTTIQVKGRRGWQRALPDYKLVQITLEKELCQKDYVE